MVKTWTVYEHISASGKVYIGITSQNNVNKRWFKGSGYAKCPAIYNAILKYGWDNFQHNIIASNLGEQTAKNMEKDLIKFYKEQGKSYNITDGGDGRLGVRMSDRGRLQLSKERKGVIPWKAVLANMQINKGRKIGPRDRKVVEKIRTTRLLNGKKCTKEQVKANIERNLAVSHPVLQFDLQDNFIKEYRSVKYASEIMGVSRGSLLNCLNPNRINKTCKGYKWKYKTI